MPFIFRLILILGFLLVFIIELNAQKSITFTYGYGKVDEIIVNNIKNGPSNFPRLKIGVSTSHLFHPLDRYSYQLRLSGEYRIGERGYVQLLRDFAIFPYLDNQFDELKDNDQRLTKNPIEPYNYTEGGLGFKLWKDKTKSTKTLPLLPNDMGTERMQRYTGEYNALVEKSIFARGGLFRYRNLVSDRYVKGNAIITEAGKTIVNEEGKSEWEGNNSLHEGFERFFHTNMFVTSIYLGAEYSTKYAVEYKVKSTGDNKRKASLWRVYADFFIGAVSFEDMILENSKGDTKKLDVAHDNKGGLKARNTGFRVGVLNQGFRGISSLSWRFESGIRPGMANVKHPHGMFLKDKWVFNFSLGYTLGVDPGIF